MKGKGTQVQVEIFEHDQFGKIRAVEIDGEPWLVGRDVATALGYNDTKHAILDHVDNEDRVNSKTQGQNVPEFGQRGTWLINESGLYSLVLSSYKMFTALQRELARHDPGEITDGDKDDAPSLPHSSLNGLLQLYFGVTTTTADRKEDPALNMLTDMLMTLGEITGHKKAAKELAQAVKHIDD